VSGFVRDGILRGCSQLGRLSQASHGKDSSVATNRWLQDPIPPSMPRHTHVPTDVPIGRTAQDGGTAVPSFNDRMLVVQTQITAIKHDVFVAQIAAKAKQVSGANCSCQVHLLPSFSAGNSASNLLTGRSLVLGLPAGPFSNTNGEEFQDDIGSELQKSKRVLGLQNGATTSFAVDGDEGTIVIGTNVSHGGDIEMNVISNPLFDEQDVMAGPDDQACLGK